MTTTPITWKETRFLKVPLIAEEIQARGEQLAELHAQLDTLLAEHDKQKKAMKEAEGRLESQMSRLASIVRERVEERSVEVEIRLNIALRLVEEIRIDTGEVVRSRSVTEEDKLRAQTMAQTTLPGTEPA